MIRGEKVIIRPMESDDIKIYHKWVTQQKYMGQYMGAKMMYKDQFIEGMEKKLTSSTSFYAMVEDKEGNILGLVNYHQLPPSDTTLELGLMIAEEEARRKGLGEEAITLFVDHIFKTKPIMRVQFRTRVDHEAVKKLAQKVGFKLEGIMRDYLFDQGKFRDYQMGAMTRSDWEEKKGIA